MPGLSDIDLTAIIDTGLNPEKEFSFLVSFWKTYERLKKVFPMLGHIDLLDEKLIKTWTRFSITGYESKYWKLIYGTETISDNYVAEPERLAIDSFNHALKLYKFPFLRDYFNQRQTSPELQRLALKILKYIDYGGNKNNRLKKSIGSCNMEGLLCYIIMEFERRLACLYTSPIKSSNMPSAADAIDIPTNPSGREIGQEYMTRLSSCQSAIEAVFFVSMAMSKPFVVLKDRLDASATRACISSVLKAFRGQMKPIILSYSVLNYMLRVQDPLRYCGFVKGMQAAYGRDLISQMQPPDEYSFIKSALDQSVEIFTYPRSKRVILPSGEDNSIQYRLRIALSAKLSLEKREFVWGLDELIEEDELLEKYEEFYPQYYERIVKSKENGSSLEHFMLLKDLADDVHECILGMNPDSKY